MHPRAHSSSPDLAEPIATSNGSAAAGGGEQEDLDESPSQPGVQDRMGSGDAEHGNQLALWPPHAGVLLRAAADIFDVTDKELCSCGRNVPVALGTLQTYFRDGNHGVSEQTIARFWRNLAAGILANIFAAFAPPRDDLAETRAVELAGDQLAFTASQWDAIARDVAALLPRRPAHQIQRVVVLRIWVTSFAISRGASQATFGAPRGMGENWRSPRFGEALKRFLELIESGTKPHQVLATALGGKHATALRKAKRWLTEQSLPSDRSELARVVNKLHAGNDADALRDRQMQLNELNVALCWTRGERWLREQVGDHFADELLTSLDMLSLRMAHELHQLGKRPYHCAIWSALFEKNAQDAIFRLRDQTNELVWRRMLDAYCAGPEGWRAYLGTFGDRALAIVERHTGFTEPQAVSRALWEAQAMDGAEIGKAPVEYVFTLDPETRAAWQVIRLAAGREAAGYASELGDAMARVLRPTAELQWHLAQAHAWAGDLRRAVTSLPDARLLSAQRLTDASVWYEQLAERTDAVDEKRSLWSRAREARLSASARLAGMSLCATRSTSPLSTTIRIFGDAPYR